MHVSWKTIAGSTSLGLSCLLGSCGSSAKLDPYYLQGITTAETETGIVATARINNAQDSVAYTLQYSDPDGSINGQIEQGEATIHAESLKQVTIDSRKDPNINPKYKDTEWDVEKIHLTLTEQDGAEFSIFLDSTANLESFIQQEAATANRT